MSKRRRKWSPIGDAIGKLKDAMIDGARRLEEMCFGFETLGPDGHRFPVVRFAIGRRSDRGRLRLEFATHADAASAMHRLRRYERPHAAPARLFVRRALLPFRPIEVRWRFSTIGVGAIVLHDVEVEGGRLPALSRR